VRAFLFVSLLVLILNACSEEPQKPNVTSSSGIVVASSDRSLCLGPFPAKASLFKNDWTVLHRSPEGLLLQRTIRFRGDSLTVIVDADDHGDHRQLKVRANIQVAESSFDILTAEEARHPKPLGPLQRTIEFSLLPMTVRYKFIGRCVQLQDPDGNIQTLTPKDRESR
jgi:hypothetical protein